MTGTQFLVFWCDTCFTSVSLTFTPLCCLWRHVFRGKVASRSRRSQWFKEKTKNKLHWTHAQSQNTPLKVIRLCGMHHVCCKINHWSIVSSFVFLRALIVTITKCLMYSDSIGSNFQWNHILPGLLKFILPAFFQKRSLFFRHLLNAVTFEKATWPEAVSDVGSCICRDRGREQHADRLYATTCRTIQVVRCRWPYLM